MFMETQAQWDLSSLERFPRFKHSGTIPKSYRFTAIR